MESPSIMSHVSVGTNHLERAVAFYDAVLATIGARRVMEHPGTVAYGKQLPEFWVGEPYDRGPATCGNGVHFAFMAASKAHVDAFFKAALDAGGVSDGEPGPRPEYSAAYYGCYIRDPDGHKIEATFWDQSALEPT